MCLVSLIGDRPGYCRQQCRWAAGFCEVVDRSGFHGKDDRSGVAFCAQHHARKIGSCFSGDADDFDSVAVGQVEIDQCGIQRLFLLEYGGGVGEACAYDAGNIVVLKHFADSSGAVGIPIDQHKRARCLFVFSDGGVAVFLCNV